MTQQEVRQLSDGVEMTMAMAKIIYDKAVMVNFDRELAGQMAMAYVIHMLCGSDGHE